MGQSDLRWRRFIRIWTCFSQVMLLPLLAESKQKDRGTDVATAPLPKLKLSYFDFHGGRGEVARIALHMAAIPFEDDRIPTSDWPTRKPSMPFGTLPVLEVDGQIVAQ